jgi:hypothetical protein
MIVFLRFFLDFNFKLENYLIDKRRKNWIPDDVSLSTKED